MNKNDITRQLSGRRQGIIDEHQMRHYAVFVPLIEKEGDLHVLFEVRAKHMKRQPGEICFPGGMVDRSDRNPAEAAVRELCEETGIHQNEAAITGSLDKIISPFRQIIFPYAGFLDLASSFHPNEEEVDKLFTVPLSFFIDNEPDRHLIHLKVEPESGFPFESIPNGKGYTWSAGTHPEYFYYYGSYVIWGLTARIMKHFVDETAAP
ncbi:NUDIX hydrolase [Salibacterium halotolerans]|uniref:8-oxo-dGTP pyrophosphatase MutT, NUDIX family n=1 Tax=Salibacterium halotolerans TaxID=1884432 RepID=A0A1I5N5R9_9BACI|nr:CoA pyrophosphatase [Salibacterium halotolerans]SFP17063.1 8-oxo-dGTP pyrophosphatase MutT, NUDIX family [Salibacterium halotolerans]